VVNTAATIVTFLMVFLIQMLKREIPKRSHLKLDELIVAEKGALNKMTDFERLTDEQLAS
jgi:low affinity Fe/Cu permease